MTEISVPHGLEQAYQLILPELNRTTDLLGGALRQTHREIDAVIRYSFLLGGKRLRPVLVLLTGKATGKVGDGHERCAAALEMIHTASLVHDDILDGALFRRHLATINAQWDAQSAVLVGDYLLSQAMLTIVPCRDTEVYRFLSEACHTTCRGELLQTMTRSRFDLSLSDYMAVIGGKTAALLECACRLGPYLSGHHNELPDRFAQFGHKLGLAFQIIDDVLDLVGDEQDTGKTLGTDIANHKPTLPLIHYLSHSTEQERKQMLALNSPETISPETTRRIRDLLEKNGSIAAARSEADRLLSDATALLTDLSPVAVTDDQKAALAALAEVACFVKERNH